MAAAGADSDDTDDTEVYDAHPAAPHWDVAVLGDVPHAPDVSPATRRARQRRTAGLISEGEIGRARRTCARRFGLRSSDAGDGAGAS